MILLRESDTTISDGLRMSFFDLALEFQFLFASFRQVGW